MKNKLLKHILLYIFICNISFAEQYRFETSEIEIINEGNVIYAKNGKAVSTDGNLEIIWDSGKTDYFFSGVMGFQKIRKNKSGSYTSGLKRLSD